MSTFDQARARVRAWDRGERRSVTVEAVNWKNARRLGFTSVLVTGVDAEEYHARLADLDFRYFGEPMDADEITRRQWARRAAADRRTFWRRVHETGRAMLELDADDPDAPYLARMARTELARRQAGRALNPPSEAVRASDQRERNRQRASHISREAHQFWLAEDRKRYA